MSQFLASKLRAALEAYSTSIFCGQITMLQKIPRVVFFVSSRNFVAQEDPVIIILLAIGLHVGQPDALESQEIDE